MTSPPGSDDEERLTAPASWLAQENADPATLVEEENQLSNNHEHLVSALATLDERSQDIVQRRWLEDNKPTLHELADEYSVSAERIRQIEKNALKKLQKAMIKSA